ncbi:MAG: hypothetical protein JWQ43_1153 [Glaciihabitans sp.]|nr:hypothetical protein [Glaciihabitans sp.]
MAISSRRDHQRGNKRRARIWIATAIVAILLFVVLWVAVRALMARDELLGAVPLGQKISNAVTSADLESVGADVAELQDRAVNAARLTSDPIWRGVELVPVIGQNLTAFRQAAAMIEQVATDALPPLVSITETVQVANFAPVDGRIELQPLIDAQPKLREAHLALQAAQGQADAINTSGSINQIGTAVGQLKQLVEQASGVVESLDTAATVLPPMLGAEGPRTYLLLSLNNSELRATGGIPAAVAVIHADQGQLSLGETTTANDLGKFDAPVLDLTEPETTLYQDVMGMYLQDVNSTPDFSRSGELAQAMWLEDTGVAVDGVIALDPVALGYIIAATGPVAVNDSITLTTDNAASTLLSGVYSMFPNTNDQDNFFAVVTGQVFTAVSTGKADPKALFSALSQSASEDRLHVWSANSDEQKALGSTGLTGTVPLSADGKTGYGVYFNDSTGAKMDYYLNASIGIASAVCRQDERPNFEVQVKLKSTAPADAATSLPAYVTGSGFRDISPGNISTNVYVYAPEGSVPYSVTVDGQEYVFVASTHDSHSVAGITVELTPGQSSTVSMKFVGLAGASDAVVLQHTPMANNVETSIDNFLDCGEVAVSSEDGASGA